MAELTNEFILEKLTNKFGDKVILSHEVSFNMLAITVNKDSILELLQYLYKEEDLGFKFLTDLTGIHYPHPDEQLGVIYHLHNLYKNSRIRLRAFFPKSKPEIDSVTPVFKGANWMERETFDFFGIIFKGHPNLKRILNVDDMTYYPLRKEYALEDETRTDKNDAMFGR
jgi:NADH-quinone oxidoreductase subunit C